MQQTQSDMVMVHKGKMGMAANSKVFYTAKTHTVGGRVGGSGKSDDNQLDVKFATPGTGNKGTNPEQMLAAGWSACFIGAMGVATKKMSVPFPKDTAVDAEVDLILTGEEYTLQARMNVTLPGMEREMAQKIVDQATRICPYSKSLEGNIDITYSLV
jgi:osmotically inducible protein OsmC